MLMLNLSKFTNSLLKGINRRIKTLGRSGEAVFARDDTPEQAAYDLAKAIDENHGALKWFIQNIYL